MNTIICRKPKSDEALVREGAKAAIHAILKIEAMRDADAYIERSAEEEFDADAQSRQGVINVVMEAIDDLPPRQRGFVLAMAEYIDFTLSKGQPNLEKWKPDAVMSHAQLERKRVREIAEMEG